MIMCANEAYLSWDQLKASITELLVAVDANDYERVRQLLREVVSGYSPEDEIVDWMYQQGRKDPL